jgi:hypothetical protein
LVASQALVIALGASFNGRRLMLAFELDPYEIALSNLSLFRHLRKRCALCRSREDCASDLARASSDQAWQGRDDWRDY